MRETLAESDWVLVGPWLVRGWVLVGHGFGVLSHLPRRAVPASSPLSVAPRRKITGYQGGGDLHLAYGIGRRAVIRDTPQHPTHGG